MSALREVPLEHDGAQLMELRVPPNSIVAEHSVLGALLFSNEAWDLVADLLTADDFYRHEHRLIYGVLGELITSSKPADVITVHERLRASGKDEDCGGLVYLNQLAHSVPTTANIRRHAELVREQAILRKMIAVCDEGSQRAFQPEGRSVTQILDAFEASALKIAEQGSRHTQVWKPLDGLLADVVGDIMANAEKGGVSLTGVSTGYADLDLQTSGLQAGDLIVLAARPSMGKTALALNIAEHVAIQEKRPVLFFSMEMGSKQLALRLLGSASRVDQAALRAGALSDEDWGRVSEGMERLAGAQVFIDETGALTPNELRARARRKARECGGQLGLIVVDYLQLMSGGETGASQENRATMLGEVSRGLKSLAKELQCPVIALSQLNRGVESRPDKRPLMSDLRESGAIEQDADVIMFIYRDDYYDKESAEPGVAEIIVAKQRNGPVGSIKLGFIKPQTKFVNRVP